MEDTSLNMMSYFGSKGKASGGGSQANNYSSTNLESINEEVAPLYSNAKPPRTVKKPAANVLGDFNMS